MAENKIKQGAMLQEFNCLYKENEEIYHDVAKKIGISDSAYEILYTIFILGDGCMQKDICETTFARKQTINSAIRKLEKEELLRMEKGKRREMHIFLTKRGTEFVNQYIAPVVQIENEVFEELGEEEGMELLRLTRKYLQYFRARMQNMR